MTNAGSFKMRLFDLGTKKSHFCFYFSDNYCCSTFSNGFLMSQTWTFSVNNWVRQNIVGGSCRVTLVAALAFSPQNFGRWQGPMNGILSVYKRRLSDAATQRQWGHRNLTAVIEFIWAFLHSEVVGTNLLYTPTSHLVKLLLPNIFVLTISSPFPHSTR